MSYRFSMYSLQPDRRFLDGSEELVKAVDGVREMVGRKVRPACEVWDNRANASGGHPVYAVWLVGDKASRVHEWIHPSVRGDILPNPDYKQEDEWNGATA